MSKDDEPDTSMGQLNQRIVAGTDGASFYIYHPQDLEHRLNSPLAWPSYHFACRPEFEAGRLVAFDTGGDGGYGFRITDGSLTSREKKWHASSWDFRYVIRHGRCYLDGGYALPSEDYFDESEDNPEQWIHLPSGNYKVTVHAIEWFSEPGAVDQTGQATDEALPAYVIQFQPVKDLDAIQISSSPPRLEPSKSWPAAESPSFADTFEEAPIELAESYVVLTSDKQAPIPGFHISLEVSDEFYQAVYGSVGSTMLPNRIEQLAIAASDNAPCLGVVAEPSGASKSGDKPWSMSFHAKRLVQVVSRQSAKPWPKAIVTRLARPESTVSDDQLNALKEAFAAYAQSNPDYRKNVDYPDFEVERVTSMNSVTGITHVLIHHVQMPMAKRLELLALSDAERAERLMILMSPSGV